MSFQDDECDFCKTYMDPIGCDTKQYVGDKAWCGQCNINHLTAADYKTENDRKAAAFDELQKTLVLIERDYWNRLWANSEYEGKALQFQRHMSFLNVEDSRRRICAKYGLESGF